MRPAAPAIRTGPGVPPGCGLQPLGSARPTTLEAMEASRAMQLPQPQAETSRRRASHRAHKALVCCCPAACEKPSQVQRASAWCSVLSQGWRTSVAPVPITARRECATDLPIAQVTPPLSSVCLLPRGRCRNDEGLQGHRPEGAHRTSRTVPAPQQHRTTNGPAYESGTVKHRNTPQ